MRITINSIFISELVYTWMFLGFLDNFYLVFQGEMLPLSRGRCHRVYQKAHTNYMYVHARLDHSTISSKLAMASQPVVSNLTTLEVRSHIRGYHACEEIWTPVIGELLLLRWEPSNCKDNRAVAVVRDGDVVGHLLYITLCPLSLDF